ncbi:hypothetical protein [Lactococcus lactis]|uniref:Uncharacterized protein n=1 Tax=Lactococcus lactis TaxID=1358 RepID=A0AAP3Z101_9LACT|nr:hypothetical protein [Lactococcus lactis]MDG4968263.1 hypothetical protein [Lactococcus lactis]MDG4976377.1 hypothetical protein [Lactococcus lactis]MDG5102181.1 hypothetical protein [Lactococcus lactis]
MKTELFIDGKSACETHIPKSVDITYKIRDGKVVKVVKSVAESP